MLALRLLKEKVINTVRAKRGNTIPEAFWAYYNKLPKRIGVTWWRDGELIVGEVLAEGVAFKTQGKSAKEFVDMVNDSLFAVYEIPIDYFALLEGNKFHPSPEGFQKLNDMAIKKSDVNFERQTATA